MDSREFSPSASPDDDLPTAAELLAQWWSMGVPDREEDEDETGSCSSPSRGTFQDSLARRTEPSVKASSRRL